MFNTVIKTLAHIAISSSLLVPLAARAAERDKGALIDVTKNPGCGIRYTTKADKIARNERLAKYYFTGYLYSSQKSLGKQYNWRDYACMSPQATTRMGFGLAPEPPEFIHMAPPPAAPKKNNFGQYEQNFVHNVFPNWGTIPGTLRIYSSENSVYYIQRFGGDSRTGEHIEYWEVDFLVVDDNGKITHWEGYNDTIGVDKLFKAILGKGVAEIGTMENYGKILAAHIAATAK